MSFKGYVDNLHFPLHNESQNWLKFFPSPGSRQARPVMAIGKLLLLLLLLAIVAVLNLIVYLSIWGFDLVERF